MDKHLTPARNGTLPLIIGFLFNSGRLSRLQACLHGDAPSDFFYGALELKAQGFDIRIFETTADVPIHWPSAAFNFLGQNGPVRLDGLYVQATKNLLPQLNECDVIVGTTPGHAFALAVWRRLQFLKAPVVGIQCGLFNHPINWWRKHSTAFLLRGMQSVLFGESELSPILDTFPKVENNVHVNQFGVDTTFWTPGPFTESGYILAVGNDGRRDYDTLVQAATKLPWNVILLTSNPLPPLPPNVKQMASSYTQGITDIRLRDLYRGARCVVVPLHPTLQPSGQSVTLQAMACGKPVVLTKTQGIWSQHTVRDGETLLLAPAGNSAVLAERIQQACAQEGTAFGEAARTAVMHYGRIESFANGILAACHRALTSESKT